VKKGDDVVEILEAFDATRSYRAAARLAGCDHHTVKKYVQLRVAHNLACVAEARSLRGT